MRTLRLHLFVLCVLLFRYISHSSFSLKSLSYDDFPMTISSMRVFERSQSVFSLLFGASICVELADSLWLLRTRPSPGRIAQRYTHNSLRPLRVCDYLCGTNLLPDKDLMKFLVLRLSRTSPAIARLQAPDALKHTAVHHQLYGRSSRRALLRGF